MALFLLWVARMELADHLIQNGPAIQFFPPQAVVLAQWRGQTGGIFSLDEIIWWIVVSETH